MTNHDAAVLGIRLSALYAGFQALGHLSAALYFAIQTAAFQNQFPVVRVTRYTQFIPTVLLAILAVLLFRKAPSLARHFLPESGNSASTPRASVNALSIGFGIAGLVGLIHSIPAIVPSITLMYRDNVFVGPTVTEFLAQFPQKIPGVIQAVVCFVILVKSRALAEWWERKQG